MSASDSSPLFFEDLAVGRVYRTATIEVDGEEAKAFAARYDPQPFHVDAAAAQQSLFGGLVISGWHTAALTMRLMVTSEFRLGSGVIGLGVEALRWPHPVRPGDRLTADVEILAMRGSETKPTHGVVKIATTTRNQDQVVVQAMTSHILVPRRTPP